MVKNSSFDNFVDLVFSVEDKKLLEDFLVGVTTEKERKALTKRVEIIKRLLEGQSQHEIANDLGVGISTVTRGSRELAQGRFKILRKKA
jgi:TrpR family transcriptional regulator, trp operon repressor